MPREMTMHNHEAKNRKLVAGTLAAAFGAGIIVLATTSIPAVLGTVAKPVDCAASAQRQTEPELPRRPIYQFHRTPKLPAPPTPPAPPVPAPVA